MISLRLVAVALISCLPVFAADFPSNPQQKSGWRLTFSDEFDGTDLDKTKWTDYSRAGTYPKYYSVKDGIFAMWFEPGYEVCGIMTFTKPGMSGGYGTSSTGRTFDGFAQKYGYYEVRMKLPDCGGGGHTAWWTVGTEDDRPPATVTQQNAEIDITEQLFYETNTWIMKFHPWDDPKIYDQDGDMRYTSTNAEKEYHIYAMEWDSTGTRFLYDNVKVAETRQSIDYRMCHILSMYARMRPDWDGVANNVYPKTWYIDYFRAYEKIYDTSPPTEKPAGLTANAPRSDRVNLAWNAVAASADPESQISGYAVYRNGTKVADVATTAFTDSGLTEMTAYSYTVAANNGAGLAGPKSDPASVTTPADTDAPLIALVRASDRTHVVVRFSEAVEQASAEAVSSYAIDNGVSVSAASLAADRINVTLTVTSLTPAVQYTLTVNAVRDRAAAPNTIAAGTEAVFQLPKGITSIRYYPRAGVASRMVNGVFEGTNGNKDTGPYREIHTITTTPVEGQWVAVYSLSHTDSAFAYVRYRGPANGNCNVAEIEFYRNSEKVTGAVFGTPGSWENSGNDYTMAFDGDTATFFAYSQLSGGYAGLDLTGSTVKALHQHRVQAAAPRIRTVCSRVEIQWPGAQRVTVALIDLRGAVVASESFTTALPVFSVDARGVAPGNYIVRMISGPVCVSQTVLVQ